jgi:hypothetical protein
VPGPRYYATRPKGVNKTATQVRPFNRKGYVDHRPERKKLQYRIPELSTKTLISRVGNYF